MLARTRLAARWEATIVGSVGAGSGTQIVADRFRLHGRLGRGGMAEVFHAHDEHLGRDVAVKLVDPGPGREGRSLDDLRREARRAAQLRHRNVVQVHDAGVDDDGRAFIVMELVTGASLADVLDDEGPLPEHRAAAIGVDVCDALAAAHRRGIVHRDVKPGNVLLDGGTARVTDFGIARALDEPDGDGRVRGTASYLAPEQVAGRPVDERVDLYALGVVLFELATGQRPFDAGSATETALRRLHRDPPRPSELAHVSPTFDAVVVKALSRDPDDRFQTVAELRAALEPLTADPSTDTRPLALGDAPAGRTRSPRRPLAWLVAALVVAVAAGSGWFALRPASDPAVPDVTGATVTAAARVLAGRGFEVGAIARQRSERPAGTVIAQDPPPGATPAGDRTVDLVVARPPISGPGTDGDADAGTADRDGAEAPADTRGVQQPDGDPADGGAPPGGQQQPDGEAPPEGPAEGPAEGRGPPGGEGPPGQDGAPPGLD